MVRIYPKSIYCKVDNKLSTLDSLSASLSEEGDVMICFDNDENNNYVLTEMSPDDARVLASQLLLMAKSSNVVKKQPGSEQ